MTKIMSNLKALASGIGKQDVDTIVSFYAIAHNQLETEAEQEVFRLGALAMFADVGKMPLKALYYRRKFRKAIRRLGA